MRYQLTLMLRNPRAIMAGLILPGALLALQLGRVQHVGQGAAASLLAAPGSAACPGCHTG